MNNQVPEVPPTLPSTDKVKEKSALFRLLLCVLIIASGATIMVLFYMMKQAPKQVEIQEQVYTVEVARVMPQDVPVVISGNGSVRVLNTVQITAEIPGRIVDIHPRLDVGEIIPKGELLFKIDPRDYSAAEAQAIAQLTQAQSVLVRLKKQQRIDQGRLETLRRSRQLAEQEFGRVKALFTKDQVGTQSGVDRAEMAYNQSSDALDMLGQIVALYPARILEAEAGEQAASAVLSLAQTRLERTEVRAPFNARIKMKQIERDQYVAPGAPVMVLADDGILELSLGLDSRQVRDWLLFKENDLDLNTAWFNHLEPVTCKIYWTDGNHGNYWEGTLNRVELFNDSNRTVSVVVRVSAAQARASGNGLPLVEGMYCKVDIPGKIMKGVFRVPRSMVSFENELFMAEDNRLIKRQVNVAHTQDGDAIIDAGLQPGELILTTRLVDPLPNSQLEYTLPEKQVTAEDVPSTEAAL